MDNAAHFRYIKNNTSPVTLKAVRPLEDTERKIIVKKERVLALLLMLLPVASAIYGVKLIRDALFTLFEPDGFQWGLMLLGLFLFMIGIVFVGGFIRYRDRKMNYRPRFKDDLDD